MKTIALRFGEMFSPEGGTIQAHQELIDQNGHVWYGKLGSPVSASIAKQITSQDGLKILLIHSGGIDRWWAYVEEIQRDIPPLDEIPEYYRGNAEKFKSWFKITRFEKADKDVMQHCVVSSSGKQLSVASRQSMSPYFIIEPEG